MAKTVGFACSIKLQWLKKAVQLLHENLDEADYKAARREIFKAEKKEQKEIDAEEKFGLKEEESNIERSLQITAEAIERNVKMVPTVFINDLEFQFPREIFAEELKEVIENQLVKVEV